MSIFWTSVLFIAQKNNCCCTAKKERHAISGSCLEYHVIPSKPGSMKHIQTNLRIFCRQNMYQIIWDTYLIDHWKMKNVMCASRHPTEFSLNLILCNWISWTTHLASFSSPRGKAWHCWKCGEMQFKVHIRSFFLTQCPRTDLNKRSLHTVNQPVNLHLLKKKKKNGSVCYLHVK